MSERSRELNTREREVVAAALYHKANKDEKTMALLLQKIQEVIKDNGLSLDDIGNLLLGEKKGVK